MSFFSGVLAADPLALLLLAFILLIVVFQWPTTLKRTKQGAEIALYGLETRYADKDIHPQTVPSINTAEANARIQLGTEKERREIGLEAIVGSNLTPHQLMDQLHARLKGLIDEAATETNPLKLEILKTRIAQFKDELYARGQQAVVQAGGRSRLGSADEDADGGRSTQSDDETATNAAPAPRPGIGFGRASIAD